MIDSIDRITYVTDSLEKSEKTFTKFFNKSPFEKISEEIQGNDSLIYRFENMNFEILKNSQDSDLRQGLFGFSLNSTNLNSLSLSVDYEAIEKNEKMENLSRLVKSYDLKQSSNFKLFINQYEKPQLSYSDESNLFALDHLVITTNQSDSIVNLYEKELGIRLALDQFVEKWGGRMLFFRTGQATIEVIDNKVEGNDKFWGLAWKIKDLKKKREYLLNNGFNVSEVKEGRKEDTLVATVKFDEIKIPTLLVQHL